MKNTHELIAFLKKANPKKNDVSAYGDMINLLIHILCHSNLTLLSENKEKLYSFIDRQIDYCQVVMTHTPELQDCYIASWRGIATKLDELQKERSEEAHD